MKNIYKKFSFIYCITNELNNKCYVGFHTTDNINDLYYGSGIYIKRAINMYGLINFRKEILEFIPNPEYNIVKDVENFWIKKLNSKVPNGYNIADGGEGGNLGTEVTNKISKKLKGRIFTEEWRKNLSNAQKGRKRSREAIEKEKATKRLKRQQGLYKKVILSKQTLEKMSNSRKGKPAWNKGLKGEEYKKHYKNGFKNMYTVNRQLNTVFEKMDNLS